MSYFGILISVVAGLMVFADFVMLPRQSRMALKWMSALYLLILLFIWIPEPFIELSKIVGVGRPVDLLIYVSVLILLREFFLSRQKQHLANKQITKLAREIALIKAVKSQK